MGVKVKESGFWVGIWTRKFVCGKLGEIVLILLLALKKLRLSILVRILTQLYLSIMIIIKMEKLW